MATAYPAHREATIVLREGSTLAVRPIRMDDEADLAHFFTDFSMESRVFSSSTRVSALVEAHPEVVEMDLNPLIVNPAGALAVDARIRVEPSSLRPPLGAR